MCRLLGLNAGRWPVAATFWLLDAPDSLAKQSHRNPDGGGIGVFGPGGTPLVVKQPIAAWDDVAFATAAREPTGTTFLAHVRHAGTGGHTLVDTHPWTRGSPPRSAGLPNIYTSTPLLRQLRPDDGDGLVGAALSGRQRAVAAAALDARTDRIHVDSAALADQPSVVVASEPMDDDPGWRPLSSGELIHVDADLTAHCRLAFPDSPAHELTLADLQPEKAESQTAGP